MKFSMDFSTANAQTLAVLQSVPEGMGSEPFFRANEFGNAYLDRQLLEMLHKELAGQLPAHAFELLQQLGAQPQRQGHLLWLEAKLESAGFLQRSPFGTWIALNTAEESAAAVRDLALQEQPAIQPTLDLADLVCEHFLAFLRGQEKGADILFQPATIALWQRFFARDHLLYQVNNRLAAHIAEATLPQQALRWLEIGGGLGSAAATLMERLPHRIDAYRFTEPFPFFLQMAQRSLQREFSSAPWSFGSLDLNQDFARQGVEHQSFDVVVVVNVLHIARNLADSLHRLHECLAPGGSLLLVECVRPSPATPIYVEFPFLLLEEFLNVEDLGPQRPHGGFLTLDHWRSLLNSSGFQICGEAPRYDEVVRHYPGLYVAAVVAQRKEL